jgi:hypothetical protein
VVVTYERACSICHKRIGSSAFVAYPQGTLAHYSCFKRTGQPAGGTGQPTGSAAAAVAAPVFDISSA